MRERDGVRPTGLQPHSLAAGALVMALCTISSFSSLGCGISGSGGGDDLPASDLEIRNIEVTTLSDSSAVLRWNTTQQASCVLSYGRNQAASELNRTSRLGVTHETTLASLDEETEYWYQIHATSPLGPQATSAARSFTTLPSSDRNDTTPPVISDVFVTGITATTATVTFRSDDRTNAKVFYGLIPSYGRVESEPSASFTRTHAILLSDLDEAETYHFRIQATNRASLGATTSDLTFDTARYPTIEIAPDTIDVAGEEEITFTIRARDISNLAGIGMVLKYDPQMVEIVSFRPGDFWSDHRGFLFLEQAADRITGLAQYAASWEIEFLHGIAVGTQADGSGAIAVVRARITGSATRSSLSLVSEAEAAGSPNPDVHTRLLDHNMTPMRFNLRGAWVIRRTS